MTAVRRFVLVTKAGGLGYQVAELLPDGPPNRVRIRRWEAKSKVWMDPSTIAPGHLIGDVPCGDRRLADIAEAERAEARIASTRTRAT